LSSRVPHDLHDRCAAFDRPRCRPQRGELQFQISNARNAAEAMITSHAPCGFQKQKIATKTARSSAAAMSSRLSMRLNLASESSSMPRVYPRWCGSRIAYRCFRLRCRTQRRCFCLSRLD
jgi:hypothetical protein